MMGTDHTLAQKSRWNSLRGNSHCCIKFLVEYTLPPLFANTLVQMVTAVLLSWTLVVLRSSN